MKKYTEMTQGEISNISNRGGGEKIELVHAIREHLDSLNLSQKARDAIAQSDLTGLAEGFGGLFTAEEVEQFVSEIYD